MANENDKIATLHPLYMELQEKRQTIHDLRCGTRALRDEGNVKTYLPKFDAETDISYKNRYTTATLLNLYDKTEEAMAGLVFAEPIELSADVPPQIVDLIEDIDNAGNHLDVFAKELFLKSFDGASCFLVNYPPKLNENESALIDQTRRPFWVMYEQSQVINWKQRQNPVTKELEYWLIVLKETVQNDNPENIFAHEPITQYRVLFLDETNSCNYQLYQEKKVKDKVEIVLIDDGFIFQASSNGISKPFNKIPFVVVGDLSNEPLFLDIADKNIEHFQTYSDYKSLIHKTCCPIPFAVGEAEEIEVISSDKLIQLPSGQGNSFGFAEVSGSSLNVIRQCLEDIKTEIAMMGLASITDNPQQQGDLTATEVVLDSVEDTSFLATQARALQDALELGFIYTAQYLGLEQGGRLELGTSWRKAKMQAEAQDLMSQSDSANKGDALLN